MPSFVHMENDKQTELCTFSENEKTNIKPNDRHPATDKNHKDMCACEIYLQRKRFHFTPLSYLFEQEFFFFSHSKRIEILSRKTERFYETKKTTTFGQ